MGALDIGIDLGTTKIIITQGTQSGVEELLHEPAIVAVNLKDDKVMAVGKEALEMLGRTPGYIRAEFPLENGVISNPDMTQYMLREYIKMACSNFVVKHRVIICVPALITGVERRAVIESVINSGGRKVYLIDEPIAAAIGAGINISEARGRMVVDIGGGTLDVAVISMSGVVTSSSIRYGGNKVDADIIKLLALKYKLAIGSKMAEQIKREVANVFDPSPDVTTIVKGRNLLTGLPSKIEISEMEIYEALQPFTDQLLFAMKRVLDQTPPELASDIHDNGIIMTGGGSLLKGLCEMLSQETRVNVRLAQDPISCVAKGTCMAFDHIGTLQNGFSSEQAYDY